MKTYGVIYQDGRTEITSIVQDEDGNPRIDTLAPNPKPDEWVPPKIVPLVKLDAPSFDPVTHEAVPEIVWFDDHVERQWNVVPLDPKSIALRQREAIKAQMQAEWDALPAWIRGPFTDKRNAAVELINKGEDDCAAALITYAEPPHGYDAEQLQTFEAVRSQLISEISNLPPV